MSDYSVNDKIKETIREAEMILVGIGGEMLPIAPEFDTDEILRPFVLSQYYASLEEQDKVIQAYTKLRKMIGAKPYFAVTLNTDDLIYRGGFEQDLVVAPCGSMAKMQCSEHIVEAAPVCRAVMEAAEALDGSAEMTKEKAEVILRERACCPVCGKPLKFHIKKEEGYLEEGYLPQWQHYNRWLSCTLNRKLCILELGVDFTYPQVVRWPFEKVAYFNQKATLIRVHSRLAQTAAELGERGISVAQDPLEWMIAHSKHVFQMKSNMF